MSKMVSGRDQLSAYMQTVLGQKPVMELTLKPDDNSDDALPRLFRADSLWQAGRGTEALAVVAQLEKEVAVRDASSDSKQQWSKQLHGSFSRGLKALTADDGDLMDAYSGFAEAAKSSSGLESVFFAERAVNIAFWMACTGRMLEAGELIASELDATPFAGGVLAFAVHMAGDSLRAEQIARGAMQKGFGDPWTVHAVAHALYSQGRSEECAIWLVDHRKTTDECTAFMRGHMEFHLALCLLDLDGAVASERLAELVSRGPLWGAMSEDDRRDYWNAAGLVNVLWKAELRGVRLEVSQTVREALAILEETNANPTKSAVFGICILRFLPEGAFRDKWKDALLMSKSEVLSTVSRAVDVLYPGGELNNGAWKAAAEILSPVAQRLAKLGASPEQREVIEEFVGVVGMRGGLGIDLATWDSRNRRPNVSFYDTVHLRGSHNP
eukprot:NODE_1818_length_1394_cov_28.247584_g1645_i0.p1 GENE.NODE_1818_length_1394_cov_28.247584_g1645_i0~~NODE_1818_length_1394_cov_28.247584_g1645_i0.p1  ORF type:complete len:460 (-),score=84.48 NODE_1818_length_1394_cov_28.247584_g1645_i0:14-1333(-)